MVSFPASWARMFSAVTTTYTMPIKPTAIGSSNRGRVEAERDIVVRRLL
jgi:hypothetical protein